MSPDQRDMLRNYGSWMQALATGQIAPYTEGQRRFVHAARGEQEPTTEFEKAWVAFCEYQVRERDRLVRLASTGALTYDQVRTLFDNRIQIGFSDEQSNVLQKQLVLQVPPHIHPTIEHWIADDDSSPELALLGDDIPEL